jgi:hypothetical protein
MFIARRRSLQACWAREVVVAARGRVPVRRPSHGDAPGAERGSPEAHDRAVTGCDQPMLEVCPETPWRRW